MKDVLIIGGGIAGTTLAWHWFLQGKSIHWIADDQPSSSHVAAGVFNPVVLKRFSPVWKAQEQLDALFPFYDRVTSYLPYPVIQLLPVWRRFHDDKERSTWIKKSNRDDLSSLMNSQLIDCHLNSIKALNGFGIVNNTGYLDTLSYMQHSMDYFEGRNEFVKGLFDYQLLMINQDYVSYKGIHAQHIIFAEGNGLSHNPWFKQLPLQGNKGQLLIIKCPELDLKQIIKSSVFLMPYKKDLFWVGATYDRDYESLEPTQDAREYLISKLDVFLKLPYEIIDQKSGIRPTTMDRRPFVGQHGDYDNLYVFNGMGSRASLIAPWAAQQLFESIYEHKSLPEEMDVARFKK